MPSDSAFTVRPHDADNDARRNDLVAGSPNGCLFQDLTFLERWMCFVIALDLTAPKSPFMRGAWHLTAVLSPA